MACIIDKSLQLKLIGVVTAELTELTKDSEFNLDINQYVKDFYSTALKSGLSAEKSAEYAQFIPTAVQMSMSLRKEGLQILPSVNTRELAKIINQFADINAVIKFVAPRADAENLKDTKDSILEDAKKPARTEPVEPDVMDEAAKDISRYPYAPFSLLTLTGQEASQVRDLSDAQIAAAFSQYLGANPSAKEIDAFRAKNVNPTKNPHAPGNSYTNIPKEDEQFYYEFYDKFFDELNRQGGTGENLVIGNHRGFKLKMASKKQIPINQAKTSEQRFAQNNEDEYFAGVGAIVSDNEGNILYFDKDYNITTEDNGKPIYHNLRKVTKTQTGTLVAKDWHLQSIPELAARFFIPSQGISTFQLLKTKRPDEYTRLINKATSMRNEQMKLLFNVREYLGQNTEGEILTSITGVSRGVLDIEKAKNVPSTQIDWANSDVEFIPMIHKAENDSGSGKIKSGLFIDVPGNMAIPMQENNFTQAEVDKILALLFDDVTYENLGEQVPVPAAVKKDLIESFVYTNKASIQVINTEGEAKIYFKGSRVKPEDIATIKPQIAQHLLARAVSKAGRVSTHYNTKHGRYRFNNDLLGRNINTFEVTDNQVVISSIPYEEFLKSNTAVKVQPNEENQIKFLNGYFEFEVSLAEQAKLGEAIGQTKLEEDDKVKPKAISPNTEFDNIEAGKQEASPADKVEEVKKKEDDEGLDSLGAGLYADRTIPMKSSAKEIAAAKAWFNNSPLSKHIGYEELFNVVNSNAWAQFVDGGILLYSGADHTALYHEAWHAFSQHFLSKNQKIDLYTELRETAVGKKALNNWLKKEGLLGKEYISPYTKAIAIEELLAEDFRQYMLSDGKLVLGKRAQRNTLFRKILNFLKELFGKITGKSLVVENTNFKVQELYNQLRVGNINQYSPSEKNVLFTKGPLNKSIEAVEGEVTGINDQDALMLVETMDSVISDIIDEQNAKIGNTKWTSALFTNTDTILPAILAEVKGRLSARREEFAAAADTVEGVEKERIIKKVLLLDDAITNWGNSREGLVEFYLDKSPFIGEQTKNIDKDRFEKTQSDINATRFDVSGADLSMKDLSSNQVLYLVKGLREYKKGVLSKNALGFTKLAPFNITWKKLISILEDSTASPRSIKEALEKASPNSPWINDLLDKLGSVDSTHHSVYDLWTDFWQTFNMAKRGLFQVSVNEISERRDDQGEIIEETSHEILVGYAAAVFRQAERDFKSYFKKVNNHAYIKDTRKIGNILDKKVLEKYRGKLGDPRMRFDFIRDIGMPISDTVDIREGLKDVNVDFIFSKLDQLMNKWNTPITDVIKALRNPFKVEDTIQQGNTSFKTTLVDLKSESTNINKILLLETKHSGLYSNSSVSTPDGNTKHEQVQMSTLSVMERAINNAASFDELTALPEMAHLHYDNNSNITSSNWMRSLFEFDETNKRFGKRKKNVTMFTDDLSGTQTIIDENHADYDYSTATSKSDKYTRLLQDIYSGLLEGRFSTITPSDKSTILGTRVSNVDSGSQSKSKNLYIDINDFVTDGARVSLAVEHAYKILLPYLGGELERINKVKAQDGSLPVIPGYTVPDSKGNMTGDKLTIFDDIANADETLRQDILDAGNLQGILAKPALQQRILKALDEYFKFSTEQTRHMLDPMVFVDKTMMDFLQRQTDLKLKLNEAKDLMLKAYTVNTFIHHIESLTVLYGDLAQYKDISKRNYGIQSTGRMHRTDQDAINYVNNVLKRPFAEKAGHKAKVFNATLDTAILKENTVESVLIPQYREALTTHFNKVYKDAATVTEAVNRVLKPYEKMDEGDAQGWINFDTYRILSKLESRWSSEQEALYLQLLNNPETISINEITQYFPPKKLQYFGPLATKGISATAFHKYSLFPLIPSAIKGRNLEQIHEQMMKQGVDYATFDSGSKVSTIVAPGRTEGDELYSDVDARTYNDQIEYTKNTIFLHYLKDQLDINAEFKGKVIFSTQLRKLIEEGLVEGGVPVDFMKGSDINARRKAWSKLTENQKLESPFYNKYKNYENKISKIVEFRKAELRREVGWTEQELASGKGNTEKLVKFIGRELDRQDLADHEIDFIRVDETGHLVHDLSVSLTANKIERALNAIVNQRLIRQKVNGEALVQLASTMMEPRAATADEQDRYRTNDLRGYRQSAHGKTLPIDVKIALQGNFEHLIRMQHADGKKIAVYSKKTQVSAAGIETTVKNINEEATLQRLNETIQDIKWRRENIDLITMVGVRIPVQGLNSMEFMAVWEFLPKEAGNVIIPPSEIVAKSGSDFDIDKLTVMMPNISMVGGEPQVIQETDNTKTHEQNLDRVTEIKSELKELRAERRILQDAKDAAYEDKGFFGGYYTQKTELDKQIDINEMLISKYQGSEDRTEKQSETLDRAWSQLDMLHSLREILEEDHLEDRKILEKPTSPKAFKRSEAQRLATINDKISKITAESKGLDGKAIENTLMYQIRDILQLEHNFINLITPNDTSLLDDLAGELSEHRTYDSRQGAFGTSEKTSPTRILEPAYNIDKHDVNAVGKDTLGMGAVDNTYNTVYNRIGAYMNPSYTTNTGKNRRSTILMDHNTLDIIEGQHKGSKGISLSHLYDFNNKNKIADVINQLMNGWLDVAKDAWIFDIQGNKQVTPTLMFLLQAGVPLKNAVYFVSNPLVKEYVEEQKIATSAFAKAMKENAQQYNFFRSKARYRVLDALNINALDHDKSKPKDEDLYTITGDLTSGMNFDEKMMKEVAATPLREAYYDDNAKAAFLHYLELEDLAKGSRDIKMRLNYDTTRSTTLFDAQKSEADYEKLLMDDKFPIEVKEAMMKESPIGSFKIAEFQLQLWGPLFELRNNKELNNFLINKLTDAKAGKKMDKIYGSEERYVEEFKSDFIVSIFTDAIKSFDINSPTYKGALIDEGSSIEKIDHLDRGVTVQPDENGEIKIYLDRKTLDLQFDQSLYAGVSGSGSLVKRKAVANHNYDTLGLARVPVAAFMYNSENRRSEYYRFSIEREYQRLLTPFKEMTQTHYFKNKYEGNLRSMPLVEGETATMHEQRVIKATYEEILRDRALDNTMNFWKMFMSDNTVADQLFELRRMHPTLEQDYNIVNDLIISEGSKVDKATGQRIKGSSYTNLALRDNRANKDEFNVYYKNVQELADPGITSIPITKESTQQDYIENARIAEFFNKLPYAAFLQSGFNTSDSLSMVRAMPTEEIANIIKSMSAKYMKLLSNQKSAEKILDPFYNKFNTHNNPNNISIRRRLKNYTISEDVSLPNRALMNNNIQPDHIMPMEFLGNEFDKIVNGDIIGTSRVLDKSVKTGDIIEFTRRGKTITRSLTVRATIDSTPVEFISPDTWAQIEGTDKSNLSSLLDKGYEQFTFEVIDANELFERENPDILEINPANKNQLESLIKNNPSVTFVLEGAVQSSGYFVQGIGSIKSYDNVMPITLRDGTNDLQSSLWSRDNTKENQNTIADSLDKIQELYDQDGSSKLVFLSGTIGYGTYLTKAEKKDSTQMRDKEAFDYLSKELYSRFGYTNKHSKVVDDVQQLMQKKQNVVDFQMEISDTELYEAQQRLRC